MADLTAVGTITPIARTVFGNKRIIIASVVIGDSSGTFPAGGLPLTPAQLGLREIDFLKTESASLVYKYDYDNHKLLAYTAPTTPGATVKLVVATGSTPLTETIRITAYGYGINNT